MHMIVSFHSDFMVVGDPVKPTDLTKLWEIWMDDTMIFNVGFF